MQFDLKARRIPILLHYLINNGAIFTEKISPLQLFDLDVDNTVDLQDNLQDEISGVSRNSDDVFGNLKILTRFR